MKNEQLEQEFEEIKDELLTYAFSEELASALPNNNCKDTKNTKNERYKLELLKKPQGNEEKLQEWKEINKNMKKVSSQVGKIIPIGSAVFKSNFECGNMSNVHLVGANIYELQLEKETNSNIISSWFYFSVEGLKGQANFIIKDFRKSSSLYNEGMKICYRDVNEQSKWRRGGTKICYTNSIQNDEDKETYELRFSFFFKSNERTCIQFAYCFPYGLKKLYRVINQIKEEATYQSLGKTFGGLDIPLLSIGNSQSKEVIIISARVHPGETVSSFIMQGFLKELVSDSQFANIMRAKYLFKIVPMLNPDGVVKGNYRFSGYGCDLNRKWKTCKQRTQPEIYFMKNLIKSCHKERKVVMYIDIHGHSRKKNVFFYGCCENNQNDQQNHKSKHFPYLMERIYDAFKYENCSFNMAKDKQGTARITVWKQMKIDYVYTLQSSFCGPQYGVNYVESDYQKIGKKLCEGIAVFFYENAEKEKGENNKAFEKMMKVKDKAFAEFTENPQILKIGVDDEVGSQSEPQAGEIPQKDRNPQTGLPKHDPNPKKQNKPKKISFPTNFFSSSSFKQDNRFKSNTLFSQVSLGEKLSHIKKSQNDLQPQQTPSKLDKNQKPQKFQRYAEIEVSMGSSNLKPEPQSFRSTGLHQRNIRIYSLTKNLERQSEKQKKNEVTQIQQLEQNNSQVRANLIRGRQGVQYRRVRKFVQQTYNIQPLEPEQANAVVKQLQGNQLNMDKFERIGRKYAVTPRFYPTSNQKNRRTSVDIYTRKHTRDVSFNKLSINGGEIGFRCMGIEIPKPYEKFIHK